MLKKSIQCLNDTIFQIFYIFSFKLTHPVNPSILHTTLASELSQLSSHTVPQTPLAYTSTRPWLLVLPPTNRTTADYKNVLYRFHFQFGDCFECNHKYDTSKILIIIIFFNNLQDKMQF